MNDIDDIVVDDSELLADRLVRSLHRNPDGHLAGNQQDHKNSIELGHNVAVIYIYTEHEDGYQLHEHYIYSSQPRTYKSWLEAVTEEINRIVDEADQTFYGVYGWATAHIKITPLRNGDLFIKVDNAGARGVRLSFSTKPDQRTACEE